MMNATIFDIRHCSYEDGPGVRTTVFFKGCNLRCQWCHNPESQNAAPELMLYPEKCTSCGRCARYCPHGLESCDLCGKCALHCPHDARELFGKTVAVDSLVREVLRDKSFYDASGGGLTVSGGECMLQLDALEEMLRKTHENGISTAVDTAGNLPWESFERILPVTDLFLYDVKCIDEELHRQGTGVSNRQILENLRRIAGIAHEKLIIRVPFIGNFNDSDEEMKRIAIFLKEIGSPKTEILSYHALGEHKYRGLGREMRQFAVPEPEKIKAFQKYLSL